MNSKIPLILLLLPPILVLLCGCSQSVAPIPTAASMVTATPDPCATENLPVEVGKINSIMQEFDDAAVVAASAPREGLTGPIAELQRIRRNAEDQPIPACLKTLKEIQLAHMSVVIETLMAFMDKANQESIDKGIALARQLHDQYLVEMAKLLGVTVVPLTNTPAP
jgi:hypothetical protein